MDITALSRHAVSVVARHLAAGTADPAADALLASLRDGLSRTAMGTTALHQWLEQPQDAARQQMAGIRQTAEAVRDAYGNRDAELLCALASRLDSGQIRGGNSTGEAFTPDECVQDMRARFDRLPAEYTEQSGDLAVERVGRGDDGDFGKVFGLGLREDDAGAILVNRDPAASCRGWELIRLCQNGRWMVDLASFTWHYVDPGGTDGYDCDIDL